MKNKINLAVIAMVITTVMQAQTNEGVSSNCSSHQWNGCGSDEAKTTVLYTGQWLRIPFETTRDSDSMMIFAELSDASGSFFAPTVIGTYMQMEPGKSHVAGVLIATIPDNIELSNAYRIRLVNEKGTQIQLVLSDITVKSMHIWFADFDGDGLGDASKSFVSISETEPGFVLNSNDTDDSVFNQTQEITGTLK